MYGATARSNSLPSVGSPMDMVSSEHVQAITGFGKPFSIPPYHSLIFSQICLCIALMLHGAVFSLSIQYLLSNKEDPKWMQWMVIILCIIDTSHGAMLVRAIVFYTLLTFQSPRLLVEIDWSVSFTILTQTTMILIVQTYYIRRLWLLSGSLLLLMIPVCLVCLSHDVEPLIFLYAKGFLLLGRIATLITLFICSYHSTWVFFGTAVLVKYILIASLSLGIAVDFMVTAPMIYYLRSDRTRFDKLRAVKTLGLT
ncbi:hypothetical protein K474DRAFT_1701645 [Panus rudis PR-1116 ss-1]|nr:hypothetical protein K474DRAFT_1701645 [Panus rudis PR-1116 ss-1]